MDQNKPSMLVPAAIGGAFLGVTSAFPLISALNCACCILVIGGGILASYFYIRSYPTALPPVTYGDGALLGLLTGAIGAAVWIAVGIPLQFLQARFLQDGDMMGRGTLDDVLNDPEIPAGMREVLEAIFEGGGVGFFAIAILVVSALSSSLVFATIGSIIGVALFGQRTKLPPPPLPPGGPVHYDTPPSSTSPPVVPGPGEPPPPPPPLNI